MKIRQWPIVVLIIALCAASVALFSAGAHADDSGRKIPATIGSNDTRAYQVEFTRPDGAKGAVWSNLFIVNVQGEELRAYCLEQSVGLRRGEARLGDWDEFPGTNNFKTKKEIREKVAWIILNSYPTLDVKKFADQAGVTDLTEKEAITAIQSAIWHFTDGIEIRAWGNNSGRLDSDIQGRMRAVYNYLIGPANIGVAEHRVEAPQFALERGSAGEAVPGLVGPLKVKADQTLALTYRGDGTVVDAQGKKIDLGAVAAGTALYIKTSAPSAGSGIFTASVSGENITGSLVITPPNATASSHSQTIVLVKKNPVQREVSVSYSWKALTPKPEPKPVPTVTSKPVPNPVPTVTPEPEPTGLKSDEKQSGPQPASQVTGPPATIPEQAQPRGKVETQDQVKVQVPAPQLTESGAKSIKATALVFALLGSGVLVFAVKEWRKEAMKS